MQVGNLTLPRCLVTSVTIKINSPKTPLLYPLKFSRITSLTEIPYHATI